MKSRVHVLRPRANEDIGAFNTCIEYVTERSAEEETHPLFTGHLAIELDVFICLSQTRVDILHKQALPVSLDYPTSKAFARQTKA